jgi:hypothetical protein
MYPILNYVEFRTNHEPYMVHGVVHDGVRLPQAGSSASWVGATSVALISVFDLFRTPNSLLITPNYLTLLRHLLFQPSAS